MTEEERESIRWDWSLCPNRLLPDCTNCRGWPPPLGPPPLGPPPPPCTCPGWPPPPPPPCTFPDWPPPPPPPCTCTGWLPQTPPPCNCPPPHSPPPCTCPGWPPPPPPPCTFPDWPPPPPPPCTCTGWLPQTPPPCNCPPPHSPPPPPPDSPPPPTPPPHSPPPPPPTPPPHSPPPPPPPPHDKISTLTSNPSLTKTTFLAIQNCLVMIGTTVITSSIIVPRMGGSDVEKAQLIRASLLVSGVSTLLQTTFGTRLPVVMGGSFRFIIPTLYISSATRFTRSYTDPAGVTHYTDPAHRFSHTMREIQGALLISSILPILAGFLGIWKIFVRLVSPLSAVPLVTLVGVGLYAQGFPLVAQCVEIGLPELIILVVFCQYIPSGWKSKWIDRFSVVISVGVVWAYAALLTAAGAYKYRRITTQTSCRVDRSDLISQASWINFPVPLQWGLPSIHDAGDVFLMLSAAFVSLIESTATFIAASRDGVATPTPHSVMSRGIGWEGIGMLLGGLWGTTSGAAASPESVGLLAVTRVGSRRVVEMSAWFLILFSIFGKLGALVASIPLPIVGASYCILSAYTSAAGLGILEYCNLNSFRTLVILGFSFYMGLSVPQYFNGYEIITGQGPVHSHSVWFNKMMEVIFTSPATVAVIVALFLDHTLLRNHKDTRRDSGRPGWEKFNNFDDDPQSSQFYSLSFGLSKYFPSI